MISRPAQKSEIEKLEASFTQQDVVPPDALTISDLEDQIDSLLRSHGQNDLWQLAAGLARRNIKPEVVESLFANLDARYRPSRSGQNRRFRGDCESVA